MAVGAGASYYEDSSTKIQGVVNDNPRMVKKKKQHKGGISRQLPDVFLDRLEKIVGRSNLESVLKTFTEKPTTFRVNTLKTDKNTVLQVLKEKGITVKRVPWFGDAFILTNKSQKAVVDLDLFAEGHIYLQSLASMAPPVVLDPQPGERVLDLTAAPGSKTSQMAAMMGQTGELVANDIHPIRAERLAHNMTMLGVDAQVDDWSFTLHREDGESLVEQYQEYFDKILVDAPCSGESRFIAGKSPTYRFWNENYVRKMAFEQQKLLMAAWRSLKPGGTLVYSTCTLSPEENERRIDKFLGSVPDAQVQTCTIPGLKMLPPVMKWEGEQYSPEVKKTLRMFPTNEIEGFFVAKINKRK